MDFSRVAFFGDSWVSGEELDNKDQSFPCLLGAQNFGIPGTGIPGLLRHFNQAEKNFDLAIFCITDPSRIMFYKTYDDYTDDIQGTALASSEHKTLQKIGNNYNDDVIVSQICYILLKWCQDLDIQCYFVNLFTGQLGESFLYKLIPDNYWLINKHSCLLKEVFDTQNYFADYLGKRELWIWLKNDNADVKKFIRPCENHPNKTGHKAIADFMNNKLL